MNRREVVTGLIASTMTLAGVSGPEPAAAKVSAADLDYEAPTDEDCIQASACAISLYNFLDHAENLLRRHEDEEGGPCCCDLCHDLRGGIYNVELCASIVECQIIPTTALWSRHNAYRRNQAARRAEAARREALNPL